MNDPRAARVGKEEERAPRRRPEAARAGERGRLMVTSQKTALPLSRDTQFQTETRHLFSPGTELGIGGFLE